MPLRFPEGDEVPERLSRLRLTPPEWLASDARAIGELNATGRAGPDGDRIFALLAPADDECAAGVLDAVG